MIVFTYIGLISTGIFLWRRRRMFNRSLFFTQVRGLRGQGVGASYQRCLDDVIENVTGFVKGETEVTPTQEESLEVDVMRVIKRIEEAKKEEKTRKKAQELIDKIKKSLD